MAKRKAPPIPVEVKIDLVLKAVIAVGVASVAVLGWKLLLVFSLILGGLAYLIK